MSLIIVHLPVQAYFLSTMAAKRTSGTRNSLGADTDALLAGWSEANYGASASQIIREAVHEHIQSRIEQEPEMKKRFQRAMQKQLENKR